MKKNQNGVTMAILVVTIIVFTILLSVTMNVSTKLLTDTKIKSYVAEMLLVQARVKSMAETLEFEGAIDPSSGALDTYKIGVIGLTGKTGDRINLPSTYFDQVSDEGKTNPGLNFWYRWNNNTLLANGFDSDMLTDGAYYFVNFKTGEVVNSKGYTPVNKPVTLYSLQNMIKYR